MEWISVKEELPPTFSKGNIYWTESRDYPVKVKGFNGWWKGHLIENKDFNAWSVAGISGDVEVTHFLPISEPPNE